MEYHPEIQRQTQGLTQGKIKVRKGPIAAKQLNWNLKVVSSPLYTFFYFVFQKENQRLLFLLFYYSVFSI